MGHRVKLHRTGVRELRVGWLGVDRLSADSYGSIEPGAGGWRTWVLASGKELRLAPPPDAQATATELQELRTLAGQRDAATLERIRYWDFWSPHTAGTSCSSKPGSLRTASGPTAIAPSPC